MTTQSAVLLFAIFVILLFALSARNSRYFKGRLKTPLGSTQLMRKQKHDSEQEVIVKNLEGGTIGLEKIGIDTSRKSSSRIEVSKLKADGDISLGPITIDRVSDERDTK